MAYGLGDRGQSKARSKPKRKKAPARPAAPSPAVRERHAAIAQARPKRYVAHKELNRTRDAAKSVPAKSPLRAVLSRDLNARRAQTRPDRKAVGSQERAAARASQRAEIQTLLDRSRKPAVHIPKGLSKRQRELFESDPQKLHEMGFKSDVVDKLFHVPAGLLAEGGALAEATYRDPVGVSLKTGKQASLAIPGAVVGAYQLATHPKKTVTEGAKAYLQRTTGRSYTQMVNDIRKEGGFAEAADIAMALAPAGAPARAGLIAGLPERAALRVSGDLVKERRRAGVTRTVIGHQLDKRKAAKLEKRLVDAEAGGDAVNVLERQAAVANRKAGAPVEVPARFAGKRQHVDVGKVRARGLYGLKTDQGTRLKAVDKTLNTLTKAEERAAYYAMAFGIRTAEQARALLPDLRDRIVAERGRENLKLRGREKKDDMLPDLHEILKDPEAHFTQNLAGVVEAVRPESLRAAREDPRLSVATREGRRFAPVQYLLDLEGRHPDELPAATAAAMQEHGLAAPLYFRSERTGGAQEFASRTLGRWGMKKDFRYTGANLRVGLQDTSTAQFTRGLARNIKAKHNWNMVAEMMDRHAIKDLNPPPGTTLSDLRTRVKKESIQEGSIAYVNPGVFKSAAKRAEKDTVAGDLAGPDAGIYAANAALRESTWKAADGIEPSETLAASRGWKVVPVEVVREIEAQTTPSGKIGRAIDIGKGKMSRALLLSGNLPWLQFQVASNLAVTAAATGGRSLNPANWLGAARWWRSLPDADKQRIGATMGLDSAGAVHSQVRLGATSNSDLVNAYRAFKAHPVFHTGIARGRGPSVSDLNPLELMAAADRKQNNAFRVLATYSRAKPEVLRQMGESMGRVDAAQARLVGILALPPDKQITALLRDRDVLERHAEAVDDWLGDYATMTALERKYINRAVMFLPYLRYSLRLVFYTLPVKHPTTTAILAELGQLRADELKKLLGGDNLYWDVGKVSFGPDGGMSVDLRRANPALNALFDAAGAKNPEQLVGVLPPLAQWLVDQGFHRSTFRGSEWRVQSRAAGYNKKAGDYGGEERARIFLSQALSIFFPYRAAKNLSVNPAAGGTDPRLDGPQGDDSLLWSPRPTRFRGTTRVQKLKAKAANRQEAFDREHRSLLGELVPLIPQPSDDVPQARLQARIRRLEDQQGKHKKRRKSGGPKYFGGGSSSGAHYFGAGR